MSISFEYAGIFINDFSHRADKTVREDIPSENKTIPKTEFFALRCVPCGGTGNVDDENCVVCRGHGVMLLAGKIDEYTDCAGCSGSGFLGADSHKICVRCEGVGAVRTRRLAR